MSHTVITVSYRDTSLSVIVSVYLCVCASVCLYVSVSVCLYVSVSVYLCVCMPVCQCVCMSVCLYVSVSVCHCILCVSVCNLTVSLLHTTQLRSSQVLNDAHFTLEAN